MVFFSQIILFIIYFTQRQLKIQKERLAESFTSALNAFQSIQRKAYDKENAELMKRTRASASSGILPPPPNSKHQNGLILFKFSNNLHNICIFYKINNIENINQN